MREFWQRPTHSVVCSSTRRMRNPICNLIYSRLHKGGAVAAGDDRGGVLHPTPGAFSSTGLKPRVNESVVWKPFRVFIVLLVFPFGSTTPAAQPQDAEYDAVAEEYVKTYLAAHPLQGTALGFHEYDCKISYYSRLAIDAELSRLRRFDDRLAKFDPAKLSPRQSIDLRILQAAVKRELFEMLDMSVFERNPMVYARAGDVNVYIKRNFAPLEDRVRSLVAIESQIPNILIAARTNLKEGVPRP